ncbi:type VI secretion system baseplate subunit TssK [Corticibacter populi]|uniref:Type VI secretion system baseplate subunit TssK n=1 Tax=Corticibacter populi TaxID=1550736 RepID=A0A3M6QMC7_9BURK|nr:type VI secretion system baseplate subunit TssK [Corticibacter populi]RMX04238.1 type VI secretion system baseplate subunit TssK [Corticibacter populi]RZS33276.1 type VI secretion system ImpJ/VasE family protein [Corticibacter populi]
MTTSQQVFWGQGAFLAPQHLQAQDDWQRAYAAQLLRLIAPFAYGFETLQWSETALQNGMVEIERFALLTADGQWLHGGTAGHGAGANASVAGRSLLELPVTDKTPITLYLALRREQTLDGLASTAGSGAALPARHTLRSTLAADPYDPQAPEAEVQLLNYQLAIVTSLDEQAAALLQAAETHAFAEIVPDGPGRFKPSPSFIAPCLRLDASANLARWSRGLRDLLLSRGLDFAAHKRQRGIRSASTSAQEVMRALMMQTFARHLPRWQEHLRLGTTSPWGLYQDLREMVAEFSVFSEDIGYFGARRASTGERGAPDAAELPDYDHHDLRRCFQLAFARASELIKGLTVGAEVGIALTYDGRFFKADLPESLFASDRMRFYLAFESDLGGQELAERLQRTGKIASLEDMPRLLQAALFGLKIDLLPVPPEELPQKTPNTTYFLVDTRHPFWQFIRDRRNIAVYTGTPAEETVIRLYPVDPAE